MTFLEFTIHDIHEPLIAGLHSLIAFYNTPE